MNNKNISKEKLAQAFRTVTDRIMANRLKMSMCVNDCGNIRRKTSKFCQVCSVDYHQKTNYNK